MVKNDLLAIKYYYSRQKSMDNNYTVGANAVTKKVDKYNRAVRTAPPKLYDLYLCLYVRSQTQEDTSLEMDFTTEYIRKLNKKLIAFFLTKVDVEEVI
jgi:hypothetical protein